MASSSTGALRLDLPEGWFPLELDPRRRSVAAETLVAHWVDVQPALAEHRAELVDLLTKTAEQALASHAVFAAGSFGLGPTGPTYAGLVIRILPWPGGAGSGLDEDALLQGLAGAAQADRAVRATERVQVGGRRMLLVRQENEGQAITSFVVPLRNGGVFANLEFTSDEAPAPEHTFAHIASTVQIGG